MILVSIIEFVIIGVLSLKLYRKNAKIKSLYESFNSKSVTSSSSNNLLKEISELKEKISRYHDEASRLNRKIQQLKQQLNQ